MMTVGLDIREADAVVRAIDGQRRAERTLRTLPTLRDHVAPADQLLFDLLDAFEVDGRVLAPSPTVRAFVRTVAKHIEAAPRLKP
jgi:hypothetical protein